MLDLTHRKMLDFFKINPDKIADRTDSNIQQEIKLFHVFIGQLKKHLNHYKSTGKTIKNYPNVGELLFSAESLMEHPICKNNDYCPQIPAPASESSGLEFFDHFRQYDIFNKALLSFEKWMIQNEMPEIYVFRALNSSGETIALCLINPTVCIRHF